MLTNAAAYIRMSSDRQEKSPAQQAEAIKQLAKTHGYTIVKTYQDDAISGGKIEERPGFVEMIRDAQDGQFKAVIAWALDRIGRLDLLRAGRAYEPLRDAGVVIVTQIDGTLDLSTFAGRLQTAVISEARADFLVSLSGATLRGKIESASKGHWLHKAPFGYCRVYYDERGNEQHVIRGRDTFTAPGNWHCELRIDEDEAPYVREIFDRYLRGEGVAQIARWMGTTKVLTRNKGTWRHNTIRVMIQNPIYCGRVVFGRRRLGNYRSVVLRDGEPTVIDRRLETGDEGTPIETIDLDLAIIPEETWHNAQAIMNSQVQRHKGAQQSMLGGIVKCHTCGGALYSDSKRDKKYYRCKACSRSTSAPVIEAMVLDLIQEHMLSPSAIAQLKQRFRQRQKLDIKGDTKATIQRKCQTLRDSIEQAETNLLSVTRPALVKRLEARIDAMEAELAELTEFTTLPQGDSTKAKWSDIEKNLAVLSTLLASAEVAKIRHVIDGLPAEITVLMGGRGVVDVFWQDANA